MAQSNHSLTDVGEPKADISALFPNSGDSQREKSSDENNITLNQYLYSGDSSDKDGDEQSVLTKQTHIELGVENGDVGVVTVSRNKPLEGNEGLASLIKKINGRERLTKDDKAFLETLKLEDFDTLYKEINVEAPRAVSQAKGEARNSRLTEVSKKIGEEELTGGDLEFIKTLKLSNLERLAEKFDRKGLPVPQSLTNTIETRKGDL